jgi:hypothetical protein
MPFSIATTFFSVIFGLTQMVNNQPSKFPRAMITLMYQNNKVPGSSLQSYDFYPDPESITITSNGLPVTTNPDYKSPANFRWDAGAFGYYETTANSTIINFNAGNITFRAQTDGPLPWTNDGSGFGPAGPLDSLPIPLHWFVYSLGSPVITYSWIDSSKDIQVAGFGGLAHMEKNWGNAFPAKWIWAEAKDLTSGTAFAFSGGDLTMAGVTIPIELSHLVGYRSANGKINWDFTPDDSRLNKTIDACAGNFEVDIYHFILPRRLNVKMNAPSSSLTSCILGPASDGFKGMSTESFITTIEITAYTHYPIGNDVVLDHVIIENGGLEFGGEFRCSQPDPCAA